jgi:L-2-hydroxyglutarate oxidase LhgO
MATHIDVAIIGGGVIGLAIARELSLRSPSLRLALLEKEKQLATGISSRNSEVIHAGLYYPKNYLKSKLCVQGRELLYPFCHTHHVPHKKIGKILVANTDEEHEFLHALALRAEYNGINDITWLTQKKLAELEPAVRAKGAFLSPSTGIIHVASLAQALEKDACDRGLVIARNSCVTHIKTQASGYVISCAGSTENIHARAVVNACGLQAVELARNIDAYPAALLPAVVFAKGDYFSYSGKNPFQHLIYPVPAGQPLTSPSAQHTGLGIHATIDMQNQLRFGPDVTLVENENYQVDDNKRDMFADVIGRYFPALDKNKLQPAFAGIRPRLRTTNKKPPDFMIQTAEQHKLPGLVQLFGIESPGLSSCLAIARYVSDHLNIF